ncbi:peptidyl-dipeptidase [marine gamma proteobacterium HTCC2080]|nr:peptidyl-dipeptidase [marine gamma proteobacterium HTCC2080]
MNVVKILSSALIPFMLGACSGEDAMKPSSEGASSSDHATVLDDNPLLTTSSLQFGYPPFDLIKNEHFEPAMIQGMAEQRAEIAAIASNVAPPTFENTLVAMEQSGQLLDRAATVFFGLSSAHTNDDIEAIQVRMSPQFAEHGDAILLDSQLFNRIDVLYRERANLSLEPESLRLLEETYRDFVRAGALLTESGQERMRAINAEMPSLQTAFRQNVLSEVNAQAIVVDDPEQLDGLSEGEIASAKAAAVERGLEDQWVIPLLNTSGQPALARLTHRDLRERIYRASVGRGSSGGDYDNRQTISKIMTLRAERANLLGYPNHAAFNLENQTAKTTEAVNERLTGLAPVAVANAKTEAAQLQALIAAEGGDFDLAAWDWAYYSERLRAQKYDFDESELKPYFELDNVLTRGVFYAAERLYGITFELRDDLPVYHETVRVWEVRNADDSVLALFVEDMYARASKRGGAWAMSYVSQSGLMGTQPVSANHLNIPRPPAGEPTLLTWDEVTTLFHEFGHALHSMFADVQYPSSLSVPRDFVEYPSQVNEMWASWPEILSNYAVHYETGESLSLELLEKVSASAQFNEGFRSTEYLAASLLDQAWHQRSVDELPDAEGVLDFEANALNEAGAYFEVVPPRYRTTYFSHIVGGYSAGYYSYIWSEVLDADTVEWFIENDGLQRDNGDHFRATLLSRGGSEDAMTLYRNFRGRDAALEPLLKRRGLTSTVE